MVATPSKEVRQKLAESLVETSLDFEKNAQWEKHYWSTIARHLLWGTVFSFILFLKWSLTISASSTWQPRNRLVTSREWENSRWDGQKVAALTLRNQHEISPYNINALENRVVMRIVYMIRADESNWCFNEFSPLLLLKKYRNGKWESQFWY